LGKVRLRRDTHRGVDDLATPDEEALLEPLRGNPLEDRRGAAKSIESSISASESPSSSSFSLGWTSANQSVSIALCFFLSVESGGAQMGQFDLRASEWGIEVPYR
jgi:hypothetical protein